MAMVKGWDEVAVGTLIVCAFALALILYAVFSLVPRRSASGSPAMAEPQGSPLGNGGVSANGRTDNGAVAARRRLPRPALLAAGLALILLLGLDTLFAERVPVHIPLQSRGGAAALTVDGTTYRFRWPAPPRHIAV